MNSLCQFCIDSNHRKFSPTARKFSQTYEIRLDPERTLEIKLTGSFTAREEKSEADAGRTALYIKSHSEAKVTNVSDGRSTERFKHGVALFVPVDKCPSWVEEHDPPLGTHCSYDLFDIEVEKLEAGDSQTIDITKDANVGGVAVKDAATALEGIRGPSAVLLSPDHLVSTQHLHLDEFNPSCVPPSGGRWVTYFSESPKVNACSTETTGCARTVGC